MNRDLIAFLIENDGVLLAPPLSGNLRSIFSVYLSFCEHANITLAATFEQFQMYMDEIREMVPGSLLFREVLGAVERKRELDYIDVLLLRLLLERITPRAAKGDIHNISVSTSHQCTSMLDRLMAALDSAEEVNSGHLLLEKLQNLLSTTPVGVQLAREREQVTAINAQYIPTCNLKKHEELLSAAVCTSNNEITSVQWYKLCKAESSCPGLLECLQRKIHYFPNINSHTDISLGDCSYLDTCHKLNTCRYTHYMQYIPESLHKAMSAKVDLANRSSKERIRIPFYTHGICCSNLVKNQLPEQWIQCDVRKFDFRILGKFAAVIADPAWNIHMNLPYGTCNDSELLELPFDQLQDEGIMFLWVTGRAIEMGKEFLNKWGYEVVHEISWIKTNQLNRTIVTGRTGHWLNHSKEHLLVGLKGDPKWINRNIDTDIIVSATRETSRKPDELYSLIERLVGPHARKLEFFGRDHNRRPGWFTIGNQLTGTRIHEVDVKKRYEQFLARVDTAEDNSN